MPTRPDFVICARNISGTGQNRTFGDENADCSYLFVPDTDLPHPKHCVDRKEWAKKVMAEARRGRKKNEFGHILVFIHGFNNNQKVVMERHRRLRADLEAAAFPGIVVSFDWPSGDFGAFYLEDLKDAADGAYQLVKDGIMLLADYQEPECTVNVHLLAHSMGAYVTRQAFSAADDIDELIGRSWHVSQIMLIAPDISARSMRAGDPRSDTLYRVCNRLTVYASRHDEALGLSNVKRAGVAPRLGRVGLPDTAPAQAVNVDCSVYWETIPSTQKVIGSRSHSWHIGDPTFTQDMIDTMLGVDRELMVTRERLAENRYALVRPAV